MFSPEFLDQLAEAVATRVADKLANHSTGTTGKRLLSTEEAASYLGLPNASSLRQRKAGGQIPEQVYVKMGGSVLYDRIALDTWISELKEAAGLTWAVKYSSCSTRMSRRGTGAI
jgi:hypothetical protein